MLNNFNHIQSAHCENGVIVSLLKAKGVDFINEPLAFGIGSGLFYIHVPFLTFNNGPAISFRTMPGRIFKQTSKYLNIDIVSKKFSNEKKAQEYLDLMLYKGEQVGCQVGVYNLSYFPIEYRFHFNAHNLVVYGKNDNRYLISDTVMETVTSLLEEELNRVRFAKGMYAPKGHLYYVKKLGIIDNNVIKKAIIKGINRNVRDMLYIPGNFGGVSGIKYTANKVRKWRDKLGVRKAGQYLGHIVRMQEEIGTGGGGFRFIYAAFLEESAKYFDNNNLLLNLSDDFTKAGDLWRLSAVKMAGVFRGINTTQKDFDDIGSVLLEIYNIEKEAFKKLSKNKLKF
ncbi:MAG: peptidase [Bacteroidetes bacterium GWE2_29_8]|nr:MAG: peptidase [Bacteroidetes bacterium GWE2_29_8]OFY17897.1 MAG: peptidase [Bacteroidetes bacterium GWF2_29_10]